jgi:peptidoglycan/xylan/chitin deacetylase (PgdA/CDA1 family)
MNFRFDRFATLYLLGAPQRCGFRKKSTIPILMYHSISDDDDTKAHPYYRTKTSPRVFKLHMQQLFDLGYSTVQVSEAATLLQNGGPRKKCAVITFDDGYSDFYTNAFPALNFHGFTATVFLPTGYIGNAPVQFKGKDCLTWGEVKELRKYGISFGSHTVTHPQLTTLAADLVKDEIVISKQTIEEKLGESVNSFAYPFAFPEGNSSFVQMLRHLLVESGYSQGVSTRIGTAGRGDDRYFLRRLPMNSLDDSSLFSAKLHGGYDWLHTIQYRSKVLKFRH